MLQKVIFSFLIFLLFNSCSEEKKAAPLTAMDTGRTFIRASLDGDFETTESILLKDEKNLALFESFKNGYNEIPKDKKQLYKQSSYNINNFLEVDDSTTIINYSNEFMKRSKDIKVVMRNKKWMVDLKYTYSGNLPID